MSGLMNSVIRMALSLSLMDRDLFVRKVSDILEQYRHDPEQMEKIAAGIYQYLEEVKSRMDTKSLIADAIGQAKVPSKEEIHELTEAINKLAAELHEQNKKSS